MRGSSILLRCNMVDQQVVWSWNTQMVFTLSTHRRTGQPRLGAAANHHRQKIQKEYNALMYRKLFL